MCLLNFTNQIAPTYFSAIRTLPLNSSSEAISFNFVIFNQGNRFNLTHFSPTVGGYYWLHISVGINPNATEISFVHGMKNYTYTSNWPILSNSIMSFDIIKYFDSYATAHIESLSSLYSDDTGQITFVGLGIEDMMKSIVALRVQIHYDKDGKILNTNSETKENWNISTEENKKLYFLIPKTGIYLITTTIQTQSLKSERVPLSGFGSHVDPSFLTPPHGTDWWNFAITNGSSISLQYQTPEIKSKMLTMSLIHLMKLTKSDKVTVNFIYIQQPVHAMLQLFLYEPLGEEKVAWAIRKVLQPLGISIVIDVNEGFPWNKQLQRINIIQSGLYYISLTATFDLKIQRSIQLFLHEYPILTLSTHNCYDTESLVPLQQSVLHKMDEGDVLHVEDPYNSVSDIKFNSISVDLLYFTGILLSQQ